LVLMPWQPRYVNITLRYDTQPRTTFAVYEGMPRGSSARAARRPGGRAEPITDLTGRVLITLRQPTAGNVELVVTRDGEATVYPLTLDQIKLLSLQTVRIVCASTIQDKHNP
jgi:hypothetical protein